jgi:hypothetical protein
MQRRDSWWVSPLSFVLLFSAFGLWATFRAFDNDHYLTVAPMHYLSPFYSPTIFLPWKLGSLSISPAILILPFPLSFRLSCYYYRKSIYRGYLADPPGCAVVEPGPLRKARFRRYTGERAFPFIVQNFHRYAFAAAVVFIALLWKDTVDAFLFTDKGVTHFGVAVGSLVFLANILLLTCYTFSCHSWRHLVGGSMDCYSCSAMDRTRYGLWKKVSFLNERHGLWAMTSLVSVALVDVYVFLVTSGILKDVRIFNL